MEKNKLQFAVLTGGNSSRFGGNKLDHVVNGKTILQQTIDKIFGQTNLSVLLIGQKNNLKISNTEFHNDIKLGLGPLRGIFTALKFASADFIFVLAGDMPYIHPKLIRFLMSKINYEKEVIIPINKGFYEPLFAIYKTSLIPCFEKSLRNGEYKISNAIENVDKIEISESMWRPYDQGGKSFLNINEKHDLTKDK